MNPGAHFCSHSNTGLISININNQIALKVSAFPIYFSIDPDQINMLLKRPFCNSDTIVMPDHKLFHVCVFESTVQDRNSMKTHFRDTLKPARV